jgi:hypothetical protein
MHRGSRGQHRELRFRLRHRNGAGVQQGNVLIVAATLGQRRPYFVIDAHIIGEDITFS